MDRAMSIGDVARACGVSVDTIRWYEKQGVLAPVQRARNGYRVYGAETIERVRVVRRAIAVGFSVAELARIFRQRAAGRPPCREVRALAARKLDDLDARIEELTALRAELAAMLDDWDARLSGTADGEAAHLLEGLSAVGSQLSGHVDHAPLRADSRELRAHERKNARLSGTADGEAAHLLDGLSAVSSRLSGEPAQTPLRAESRQLRAGDERTSK
jgi:DNA-binding transcriptional MerR regulator